MGGFLLTTSRIGGPFNLIGSLFSRRMRQGYVRGPDRHTADLSIVTILSQVILRTLDYLKLPMAMVGGCLEFTLNLFRLNGGVFWTLIKILTGRVKVPKSHTEHYLSSVGLLHSDFKLYKDPENEKISTLPTEAGNRYFGYLSIMAAKIAYENQMVIKHHVTTDWKMNFVDFYSCWNVEHGRRDTQAFMFTDRKDDAQLIVLAFRGTQPFDADDWKTDFDFSTYTWDGFGRVHFGFLEALGLASRTPNKILDRLGFEELEDSGDTIYTSPLLVNPDEHKRCDIIKPLDIYGEAGDPEKPLAFYVIVDKLIRLLETHKNAKFIVTGHSLGGALAALFAGVLLGCSDDVLRNRRTMLMERLLAVYTFGQPRIGDTQFAQFVKNGLKNRYFRIVYSFDLVPTVPFDDALMKYKHFGVGFLFDCFFSKKNLKDEPVTEEISWIRGTLRFLLRSILFFIPKRVVALWELCGAICRHFFKGERCKENMLSIIIRLFAFILPEISAHVPINYLNSVSLGPEELDPRPHHDLKHLSVPYAWSPKPFSYHS